jgi:hypothetical protein
MAVLVLATLAAVASAKSFLQAEVGAKSVERALLSELSGMADATQLNRIDEELTPMYAALPKNEHGRLDPPSVRYALHRYFMQKHGWYVNGLGPVSNSSTSSAYTTILKDRAPTFIQNLFEQRLHGQGLNRHDLAVFTATMTDLIHKEVIGVLEGVYEALELPTVGPVTEKEYEMGSKAYLLTYLSRGMKEVSQQEEFSSVERAWSVDYPAWDDTSLWAKDLSQTFDLSQQTRTNPFVRQRRSFEKHISFLQELGHRLGTFQNMECRKLKDQLVEMEDVGTGRVPLSRFYRGGLDGEWTFTESVEYLRHIGALDDTDPKKMSVVIPNYIKSQSNCLAGSSFYSVCCFDECEDLLGHVEQQIKGPSAEPWRIADVVSRLHSDTVHAPRNLSTAMISRLGEIGQLHDGQVPLHGRLFAQWMHHAFPRECPFPHVIGATNRISPDDWMDMMDLESAEASEQEMALLVSDETQLIMTPEAKADALPWSMAEELVAGHKSMSESSTTWASLLRIAVSAVFLTSLAVPLARAGNTDAAVRIDSKPMRCLV